MTLAEKLQALNQTQALASYEIASQTEKMGEKISPTYWFELSKGQKKNISANKLFALARLFNVPMRYLQDDQITSPAEAILAEAQGLSKEELNKLITQLQTALK